MEETGCQCCGLSCAGVRVVPLAREREVLAARAGELGVRHPFDGDGLRLVMGTCVFYDRGCRLHARWGAEAKPAVCRQFPWVRRGEVVGVDPACAHGSRHVERPERLLGTTAAPRAPLAGKGLEGLAGGLEVSLADVAAAWRAVPWAFWMDQGAAGPMRREGVAALARLVPPVAWPTWPAGAEAVKTAWRLGLTDDPAMVLVGAVVIAAGVPEVERAKALAVWVRSLRG